MSDASKLLLGVVGSSARHSTEFSADPAVYAAGLACRLKSDGTVSLIKADGGWLGVSLGRSLSDTKRIAICREGHKVPIQMELKRSSCVVTISSYANLVSGSADTLTVGAQAFTAQAGAATPTEATFQAATSNAATAISLAAQINAHVVTAALVRAIAVGDTVIIYAVIAGAATGHDVAVAYADNDANIGITIAGLEDGKLDGGSAAAPDQDLAVPGESVYINDATGKADVAPLSTISGATYDSDSLVGITEAALEVPAAYIEMQGGL